MGVANIFYRVNKASTGYWGFSTSHTAWSQRFGDGTQRIGLEKAIFIGFKHKM
jgi:hypothetical protein